MGSLQAFEGGKGYWLVATSDFEFSFAAPSLTRTAVEQLDPRVVPAEYSYVQSENQAFFFVNTATIQGEALTAEDLVIAYNGDKVIGSRYWNGEFTDVPAMSANDGDEISFKVLDHSTGELVDMDVDGSVTWFVNGIEIVNMASVYVPTEASLGSAYPNPFNPVTRLAYDVPAEMLVSMGVYDLRGRLVDELVNGMLDQGRYEVVWNADNHASGVYMIKLTAGDAVQIQKVLLVK